MSIKQPTRVIAIASGKGGVGKTMVSANLASALASKRRKVLLFDADLGLANAQLALGVRVPFNFSHVLNGEKTLKDIIIDVSENLRFVPGGSGIQKLANLDGVLSAGIVSAFSEITEDIDFFIVDIAAGISDSVMTFLGACPERYIVVNNDPSSIADAYGTIKVMIEEYKLENISIIPNKVTNQDEGETLSRHLNKVTNKFLGKETKYLHSISQDEMVERSLKASQPVLSFSPSCRASQDIKALADKVDSLPAISTTYGGIQFFIERINLQHSA